MESPGIGRRSRQRRPALAAAALLALAAGTHPAPAHGAQAASGGPEPRAASAEARAGGEASPAGAAGGSDAVAEKFRRLQKEMTRPGSGAAASDAARPAPAASEPAGLLPVSLKILFGLAFVILLAVVCIRALKRLQGNILARPGHAGGGNLIEVLETCHLGPQQRVVALRIDGEVGIVGVTQHGISLLTTLPQPADEVRRRMAGAGNPAAFSESLNKLLDRFKKPKRVSDLLDEQA
jgi:flagellar biogenesis protein FliO